jgi:hypothetical protein
MVKTSLDNIGLLTSRAVKGPAGLFDLPQLLRGRLPRDVRTAAATWVVLQNDPSPTGAWSLQCCAVINQARRGNSRCPVSIHICCLVVTQPALSIGVSLIPGVDPGVLPDDA